MATVLVQLPDTLFISCVCCRVAGEIAYVRDIPESLAKPPPLQASLCPASVPVSERSQLQKCQTSRPLQQLSDPSCGFSSREAQLYLERCWPQLVQLHEDDLKIPEFGRQQRHVATVRMLVVWPGALRAKDCKKDRHWVILG